MRAATYRGYKESGIGWIKRIPLDWDVLPLYAVASECDESNEGMLEINLLSLSYGRIVNKDINSNDGLLPESFETYQVVQPEDMVLRLTDLQNDKRSLRSAIVRERGIITSAYLALRPHGVFADYFAYLLRSYDLSKVFYSMGGGLRQSMKFSDVKRMPIVFPSMDEQRTIASFLDQETIKIDSLISEQEKLVELLKEKRQTVISNAVTHGIEPRVTKKKSGVKWLEEIPEHWSMKPVNSIATMNDEVLSENTDDEFELEYVDIGSVNLSKGITSTELHKFKDAPSRARRIVRHGDVIVSTVRTYLKSIAFIKSPSPNMIVSTGFAVIRPKAELLSEFAKYSFQSHRFIDEVIARSTGISYPAINSSEIAHIKLPIPPVDEQQKISDYLNVETEKIDGLIEEAARAEKILKERRAALISEAVTGQIDVRHFIVETEGK